MRVRRPVRGLLAVLLAVTACFLSSGQPSYGQGVTGVDPLQMLQGLSPEQRDSILKAMSGADSLRCFLEFLRHGPRTVRIR